MSVLLHAIKIGGRLYIKTLNAKQSALIRKYIVHLQKKIKNKVRIFFSNQM